MSGGKRALKFSGLVARAPHSPEQGESIVDLGRDAVTTSPESGSGLDAEPAEVAGRIRTRVPLHLIDDSPYQPRLVYDEGRIAELASSLQRDGQEEEVQLRKQGDRFELIGGHRRVRAARLNQWTDIWAVIRTCSDQEAERAVLLQADAGVDLCDFERALLYRRTLDHGLANSQAEVAAMYEKTQGWISRSLSFFKLPPAVVTYLCAKPRILTVKGSEALVKLIAEARLAPDTASELLLDVFDRFVGREGQEGSGDASIVATVRARIAAKDRVTDTAESMVATTRRGKTIFRLRVNGDRLVIDAVAKGRLTPELREKLMAVLSEAAHEEQGEK